jgi:hypothetical protein
MTYVLNNTASMLASQAAERSVAAADHGPSIWQRVFAAIVESRRRSAERELRARSYLINEAEIVLGGFPQTALNEAAKLPFNR